MRNLNGTVFLPSISKNNNFNIVRLIAALQVAFSHGAHHLDVILGPSFLFVSYLPAVPAFFGISGFLITNAYCRNPNLKKYIRNRALRLYPGLWVCLLLTVVLLLVFQVIDFSTIASLSFIRWIFCQATFFQFYTPDYLRGWGVGTPNGSLWTISVELQFYIFLPVYILVMKNVRKIFFIMISALLFLASWKTGLILENMGESTLAGKLLHVSLAPYLHYFFLGVWSFFLWDSIKGSFENRFYLWLLVYVGYILIFRVLLNWYQPSYYPGILAWIANCLQWCMVLSFAFTHPSLSYTILKENDISYGLYIYHMVIVNCMLSISLPFSPQIKLMVMLLTTILVAFLSWRYIEMPALRQKK
ncbi:MAG TPA: acyltransferase [Sediminibacterium sp.]